MQMRFFAGTLQRSIPHNPLHHKALMPIPHQKLCRKIAEISFQPKSIDKQATKRASFCTE